MTKIHLFNNKARVGEELKWSIKVARVVTPPKKKKSSNLISPCFSITFRKILMEEQLWRACSNGKIKEVQTLLQDSHINTNWQSNFDHSGGSTPLLRACQEGHIGIVKLLLRDKRIDVCKSDKYDCTPFYVACGRGHIEIVKLLLNDKRVDVNKANIGGFFPFYIACQNGYVEVVKLLLNDNRVDINQTRYFQTPFYIACYYGHVGIVENILASGKEVSFNERDREGKTAMDIMREKVKDGKRVWESEQRYQERKENWFNIIEIFESFQRNPNEMRVKLRIRLGIAGKSIYLLILNFISIFSHKILNYTSRQRCCFNLFNNSSSI